jgi:Fasciclin domain
MRSNLFLLLASLLLLNHFTVAFTHQGLFRQGPPVLNTQGQGDIQSPMNPGPVQPPSRRPDTSHGGDTTVTISDVLPKTRNINIFASLTRDISSVSDRLGSMLPADNTTLLAPLNSAMQALPRKPWEDRPGDQSIGGAARNEDKAAENLRRFVLEHIVPTSPWKEGKAGKISTLGGQEVWWEHKDGKTVVMPGNVEVDGVVGRVGNGEIWAMKRAMNYQ